MVADSVLCSYLQAFISMTVTTEDVAGQRLRVDRDSQGWCVPSRRDCAVIYESQKFSLVLHSFSWSAHPPINHFVTVLWLMQLKGKVQYKQSAMGIIAPPKKVVINGS